MTPNVLVIIPARSGSKGIKNKNIVDFNGEPLVVRTIRQAMRIFDRDNIFISTDSVKYADIIFKETGIKISSFRPTNISKDASTNDEYIFHALSNCDHEKYDWILILQCTSPLREDDVVLKVLNEIRQSNNFDMVTTINVTNSNPYYVQRILKDDLSIVPLFPDLNYINRQECPVVHELNGAVFLINKKSLFEKKRKNWRIKGVEIEREFAIDIDDDFDLQVAKTLDRKRRRNV